MLGRYFGETFHLLHLVFLKPLTLAEEMGRLSRKERLLILLKILPVSLVLVLVMLEVHAAVVGHFFDWFAAFILVLLSVLLGVLLVGLFVGMLGKWSGILLSALFGLPLGILLGVWSGARNSVGSVLLGVLLGGSFTGLLSELLGKRGGGWSWRWSEVPLSVLLGILLGVPLGALLDGDSGLEHWSFFLWCPLVVFSFWCRLFYWPFQLVQYHRAKQAIDPFPLFQSSPVYWDEVIALQLPYLTSWLVKLVESDRERGLAEIRLVAASRPHQRRATQKALIILAVRELDQLDNLEKLATARRVLRFVPVDAEYLPRGFAGVRRRLDTIAQTVQDYLTRVTPTGRMNLLRELQDQLSELQLMVSVIGLPVGPSLQPLASRWLHLVEQEQIECRKQLASAPLPNPYVAGNPLQPRDHELFKGRRDIIVAIEEHIINSDRSTTLLLYGRRRIGKTSTLLNLPRLLSSQFVPVFVDLQEAKWHDSDVAFCYQLVRSLTDELRAQDASLDLGEPQLEQFKQYPFTTLDEALSRVEEIARQLKKRILLTFDEYERLEEGLKAGKLSTAILDQLRHIAQHREDITVLFSGSHRFEELRGIAWSDYLINAETLELSFLSEEDANALLTEPVPDLVYQSDAIAKVRALTHCQPYLLQAVASKLVNSLNSQNKLEAQVEDIEAAAEKVLVTVQGYFYYTWQEECSEEEKIVLRALAANGEASLSSSQDPEAARSLCHKGILENVNQQYRFTIELFRRWIVRNQDISGSVRQSA